MSVVAGSVLLFKEMPFFNLRGRRDRKPTEPLGFTSAADPRQLQFGVRLNF